MDQQVSSTNQQAINVKEHLAKLDKYDNEKLSLVVAIAAVLSAAFFLAPIFALVNLLLLASRLPSFPRFSRL